MASMKVKVVMGEGEVVGLVACTRNDLVMLGKVFALAINDLDAEKAKELGLQNETLLAARADKEETLDCIASFMARAPFDVLVDEMEEIMQRGLQA